MYKDNIIGYANSLLPSSIRILDLQLVSNEFHARYSAKQKTYQYLFYFGKNEDWNKICIDLHNDDLINSKIYFLGSGFSKTLLYNMTLLSVHPIYDRLHLLISNSESSSPVVTADLFSVSVSVFSVSQIRLFVSYFRFYIQVMSYGICLFLTNFA